MKCKVCNIEIKLEDDPNIHLIEDHPKEFMLALYYIAIDQEHRFTILKELIEF